MVLTNHDSPAIETVDWTADRVVALAPDPASAKNGKSLATLNKWGNLGKDQPAIPNSKSSK